MPLPTQLPGLQYLYPNSAPPHDLAADLIIYGGSSAGVAAALQARRFGLSVIIAEPSAHLGGLTASGLGATDIGNKAAIGGIAREFYRAMGQAYHADEHWTFEPHVAEKWFNEQCSNNNVPVLLNHHLATVTKPGPDILAIALDNGSILRGRCFIDASYEGDLLAAANVRFHIGREPNRTYQETLNGIQFGHPNHNFNRFIDPYNIPGHPHSGLLPGIQSLPPGIPGQGDSSVQAYNFRVCLAAKGPHQVPFPKPASYEPHRYELLLRYLLAGVWDALRLTVRMPHGKTDTNNFGAVSSDHIGANYDWPTASFTRREEIFQDHVLYNAGLYWFLAHDPRVPARVRADVLQWGLPADEFITTSHWPHALYVREARRMISDYVMTEHECRGLRTPEDPIALAAYTMDSHNCRRIVVDGRVYNEGNVETGGFPPYPISYRAIVPRTADCSNLLVPVCLSSSHIAYGSIRMEPVFMILGQSAATAAALAMAAGSPVQDVAYADLRAQLLKDRQILAWPAPATPISGGP